MVFSRMIVHHKSISAVVSDSLHSTIISSPGQADMLLGVNTTDLLTEKDMQSLSCETHWLLLSGAM